MTSVLYVSWSVLPSRMANAVQVVRMVNALSNAGARVALIARRAHGDQRPKKEIGAACGLDPRVDLELLPAARAKAGSRLVFLGGWMKQRFGPVDLIYSRVLPVFFAPLPAPTRIYEIHEPPRATWRLKPRFFDHVLQSGALTDLVYISGGLRRIIETEHPRAASGAHRTHVLHSGGAEPGCYRDPPPPEPFVLGYAGSIGKLNMTIVSELAQNDPTLQINLYGDPPTTVPATARVPGVFFRGWVEGADLINRLAEAHVLIAPYAPVRAASWLSPVKLFDYAAAGRPILMTDLPTIREIFPNDVIGRLVPENDVNAWRREIEHLRLSPNFREKLGRAGLTFARRFGFEYRAQKILQLASPGAGTHS